MIVVHKNATFGVTVFGNHASASLRHRLTRTWYTSSKVSLDAQFNDAQIPFPLFFTSVMVAGVDDAIQRAEAAERLRSSVVRCEKKNRRKDQLRKGPLNRSAREQRAREASSRPGVVTLQAGKMNKKTQRLLSETSVIKVNLGTLIRGSDPDDEFEPFYRESLGTAPAPTSVGPTAKGAGKGTPNTEKYFHFRGERQLEGRVWAVNAFDEENELQLCSNGMILKVATIRRDIEELRKEYEGYMELSMIQYPHIVKVFGLFSAAPGQPNCSLLLMEKSSGLPLSKVIIKDQEQRTV
ncbi:hypothetical protein CVT24_013104 [Panaeolus cyanescens]|uniref:Protein kinase domain-containing protein n=1 Tax=Panaeolus cyanescens TaxID=181874 RepID=A0A409YNA4_9AGAR|nr:hypothetical protein CVT24_013104 [Panaeolus cyanescens]